MALTESKIKDLEDKAFEELYDNNEEEWMETTENAFVAAKDWICGGKRPRPDDVLKMLLPMLEPNEKIRRHQEAVRARFKHYREAFGEYLVDKYFIANPEDE
ncbi:MAG: hypothetical protein ABSF97_12430 [Candidatus Sulfotelmatobacter sp.]